MASRKVETAVQEVALAAFYENAPRAARMLKDVPSEHAARLLEGALRMGVMVIPFIVPKEVEEILAKFGLGVVAFSEMANAPVNGTTTETN